MIKKERKYTGRHRPLVMTADMIASTRAMIESGLTAKTAATIVAYKLGVSHSTIYKWVHKDFLKSKITDYKSIGYTGTPQKTDYSEWDSRVRAAKITGATCGAADG